MAYFAPRHFLRMARNLHLKEYFQGRSLLPGVSFPEGDEASIDAIFQAWQSLPPKQRVSVDVDFQAIDALATEHATRVFLEQAGLQRSELEGEFIESEGHHDKAFIVFLRHRSLFDRVHQLIGADDRPAKYWIKRNDLPDFTLNFDDGNLGRLAYSLRFYFKEAEGRGHVCVIEPLRRGDVTYFFCYLEDHGRTEMAFGDDDTLRRVASRPAFEVIFAVSPTGRSLDVFYEGPKKTVKPLQTLFARNILGFDLPEQRNEKVYELNPLKQRDFPWVFPPSSGIVSVVTKHLIFSAIGGLNRQTMARADTTDSRFAVYDFMDDMFDTGTPGSDSGKLPLAAFNVKQARIQVTFQPVPRRRPPSVTFNVSFPNSCSLGHEDRDAFIREMLRLSGIEQRATVTKQRELVGSASS